jgi:1,6-anhydro-N-acetylmuramate kinase
VFADGALTLLAAAGHAPADVRAIGSHGQTVRHRPRAPYPFSMKIGDPSRIAAETGITTVADFRRRDIAAGGSAHNGHLLEQLAARMRGAEVETPDSHRVPGDWVEAMAFAWLARESLEQRPGNLPAVTGARGPRTLGAIHPG